MKPKIGSYVLSIVGGLFLQAAFLAGAEAAQTREITPITQWEGQAGKIGGGDMGYLCSQLDLKEFWKQWQIVKPMPKIDFKNELAVFYMGNGGPVLMNLLLEKSGNLIAEFVQTPTVSRRPNILIITVHRDGVKSLNGNPVHCSQGRRGIGDGP